MTPHKNTGYVMQQQVWIISSTLPLLPRANPLERDPFVGVGFL